MKRKSSGLDARFVRRARWKQDSFALESNELLSEFGDYCRSSAHLTDAQAKNKGDISSTERRIMKDQRKRMPMNVSKYLKQSLPQGTELPRDAFSMASLLMTGGTDMITRYIGQLQEHSFESTSQNLYLQAIIEFCAMLTGKLAAESVRQAVTADGSFISRWQLFTTSIATTKRKKDNLAKRSGRSVLNEDFLLSKNMWLKDPATQIPLVVKHAERSLVELQTFFKTEGTASKTTYTREELMKAVSERCRVAYDVWLHRWFSDGTQSRCFSSGARHAGESNCTR